MVENVVTFPKLMESQQVTLKALRWEERDKRLVIKDAGLSDRLADEAREREWKNHYVKIRRVFIINFLGRI